MFKLSMSFATQVIKDEKEELKMQVFDGCSENIELSKCKIGKQNVSRRSIFLLMRKYVKYKYIFNFVSP